MSKIKKSKNRFLVGYQSGRGTVYSSSKGGESLMGGFIGTMTKGQAEKEARELPSKECVRCVYELVPVKRFRGRPK